MTIKQTTMLNAKRILGLLFVLLNSTCIAQIQTTDCELSLNINPSFHKTSNIIISKNLKSNSIKFEIEHSFYDIVILNDQDLNDLLLFLQSYKFQIKGPKDTIATKKKVINGDTTLIYEISYGTDGIGIEGIFDQAKSSNTFSFWSPKKESQNAKLMQIIFSILDKAFNAEEPKNYVKQIREYF